LLLQLVNYLVAMPIAASIAGSLGLGTGSNQSMAVAPML